MRLQRFERCRRLDRDWPSEWRERPALQSALEQGRQRSASRLVVDLAGVDYLSSAGLNALELSARRCERDGGRLVLAAVPEPVRIAVELAGLAGQLEMAPSIEAAARLLTP